VGFVVYQIHHLGLSVSLTRLLWLSTSPTTVSLLASHSTRFAVCSMEWVCAASCSSTSSASGLYGGRRANSQLLSSSDRVISHPVRCTLRAHPLNPPTPSSITP